MAEQMSIKEINQVLTFAYNHQVPVEISLLSKEVVCGYFFGQAYEDELVINQTSVYWEQISCIIIVEKEKCVGKKDAPLPYPFS